MPLIICVFLGRQSTDCAIVGNCVMPESVGGAGRFESSRKISKDISTPSSWMPSVKGEVKNDGYGQWGDPHQ